MADGNTRALGTQHKRSKGRAGKSGTPAFIGVYARTEGRYYPYLDGVHLSTHEPVSIGQIDLLRASKALVKLAAVLYSTHYKGWL